MYKLYIIAYKIRVCDLRLKTEISVKVILFTTFGFLTLCERTRGVDANVQIAQHGPLRLSERRKKGKTRFGLFRDTTSL